MNFHKYAEKGNKIVSEVAIELGFPKDHELAGRMLRSVLHVLRDRLTVAESFQMMAQLPLVIKGIYVEGWNINHKPKKIKTILAFVSAVIKEDYPMARKDISTVKEGQNATMAVFRVLKRHISAGEIEDMIAVMPSGLIPLWSPERTSKLASDKSQ